MNTDISMYVIESYDLVRNLYVNKLSEDFNVKGNFKDEASCLKTFSACPSDIILMDLRLPYKSSFNFIEKIKAKYPETKIIILTTVDDEEIMYITATLGVSGYLLKDTSFNILKDTIRQIYNGKMCFQESKGPRVLI